MKIGVDYSSVIVKKTGIGSFASYLVKTMAVKAQGMEFLRYQPVGERDLNTLGRIYWESVLLGRKAAKDKADILYSPGFSPPPYSRCPRVVTVHDLIGLIYPGNVRPAARFYWSKWLPSNLKKAEVLVASSHSTKRDIVKFLSIPEDKIQVVPLAVNSFYEKTGDAEAIEVTLKKYGIKKPFFISVSTLEPRKNFIRLLRAYEVLKKRGQGHFSIVIVGKPGGAQGELDHFVREKGLSDAVHFLGYTCDEDLIYLYNAALGYVMISLYEGFGLPVLEAMSCGLAGIISNNSSLPEVAGNTALSVDPENEDEIADALFRFFSESQLREKMAEAAYARSKEFSIERTAHQMLDIFKHAV